MKIQQQALCERLSSLGKDPEYMEGFQVKLNALVSIKCLIYIKFPKLSHSSDYSAQLSGLSQS